jgi:hypothetical protein
MQLIYTVHFWQMHTSQQSGSSSCQSYHTPCLHLRGHLYRQIIPRQLFSPSCTCTLPGYTTLPVHYLKPTHQILLHRQPAVSSEATRSRSLTARKEDCSQDSNAISRRRLCSRKPLLTNGLALMQGRQDMEDGALREKMKGFGIGKSNEKRKEERKARKGRVERDLEDVIAWVKSYTRQNDTVSRRERVAAHGRSPFSPYLQSTRLLFRPVDRSSQQRHTNHLHRRLVSQSLIKKMVNPQRQRRPTIMLAKGHISDTWV